MSYLLHPPQARLVPLTVASDQLHEFTIGVPQPFIEAAPASTRGQAFDAVAQFGQRHDARRRTLDENSFS
jgi:hypothetical protein